MATFVVTGDQYKIIDRRMTEIKRMLNQKKGSPLDPEAVAVALQDIIEGKFGAVKYAARFAVAIEACGFTWWNQERITPENFPGESFEGGDYGLEYRRLPSNSHGYLAAEIGGVVLAWKKGDATILGSASAGDGLFFSKEVKAGQRDQPNGWIVCPGSTSVGGEMLCLHRDDVSRRANVLSRAHRWFDVDFFLLRKVPAKGGQAQS